MNNLKVGIAGYGVVGKRRKECVDQHPNMKIVAVCDREFLGNERNNNVNYYQSYRELLSEDLDILIVCLIFFQN